MIGLVHWVKLAGLLAATLVAGGCGASGLPGVDDTITVTAQFDNAIGLYAGNNVAILGMPVGQVERITAKGSYVEVTMRIDASVDVPADVQAVTVSTSVLTDRHIELTPPFRGGPKLRDHDTIGLGRTKTPVEFDRVLAMVDKLSTQLQGDHSGAGPFADLLDIGADITRGNGDDIRSALDELSRALRLHDDNGAHSRQAITSIIDNLSVMSQAATENDQTIREFGSAFRALSEMLAEENVGGGDTGAKLNEILQQTTELLQNNRAQLKSTITDTDTVSRAVVDYRREIAEFFDVAPLFLDNAYNVVDQPNGALRGHLLLDKVLFESQMAKEMCNLLGRKDLGCNTGTIMDYGPDFGVSALLTHMAGMR